MIAKHVIRVARKGNKLIAVDETDNMVYELDPMSPFVIGQEYSDITLFQRYITNQYKVGPPARMADKVVASKEVKPTPIPEAAKPEGKKNFWAFPGHPKSESPVPLEGSRLAPPPQPPVVEEVVAPVVVEEPVVVEAPKVEEPVPAPVVVMPEVSAEIETITPSVIDEHVEEPYVSTEQVVGVSVEDKIEELSEGKHKRKSKKHKE
jgi:hypothetical protein